MAEGVDMVKNLALKGGGYEGAKGAGGCVAEEGEGTGEGAAGDGEGLVGGEGGGRASATTFWVPGRCWNVA